VGNGERGGKKIWRAALMTDGSIIIRGRRAFQPGSVVLGNYILVTRDLAGAGPGHNKKKTKNTQKRRGPDPSERPPAPG